MKTNTAELRGGLNGSSVSGNGRSTLKEALAKINGGATTKPRKLCILSATGAPTQTNKGMRATEIAEHVNKVATVAYEFISQLAMPRIADYECDLDEVGDVIDLEIVEGNTTRKDQYREFQQHIHDIRRFVPENDFDGVLQDEIAEFPGKKAMIEAMCVRVRDMATIAIIEFELAHAAEKENLESILEEVAAGVDTEKKIFQRVTTSEGNAQLWAFRQGWEVIPGTFAGYYNFAVEKFADVIRNRSRELATQHVAEERTRRQEALMPKVNRVTAEELLFGNPRDVNGKEAVLSWKYQGHENAVIVQRDGNQLLIVEVVGGKIAQDLNAMRDDAGGKPFVLLNRILSQDGQSLCPDLGVDGKIRYEFSGSVPPAGFKMTCWVRTGAGASCSPSRIIGGKKTATRPSKPLGELLTDEEFFNGWLGEYDLLFPSDFRFEDRDNKMEWDFEKEGVVRIERKQGQKGDVIVAKSATTEELAIFMEEACGAENYGKHECIFAILGEYQEGDKGNMLPKALAIGLKLAYGRMKVNQSAS